MFFEEEELPRTKAVLKPRKLDGVSADEFARISGIPGHGTSQG